MTDQPMGPFIDRYTVRCDRFFPHPTRRVWEAVTRAEHLTTWLSRGTRVDARAGGRFRFAAGGPIETVATGTIAEFRPYKVVDYAFDSGGCIRFELSPVPGGTRLVITHSSPPNTPDPDAGDRPGEDLDLPRGAESPHRPGLDRSTVFRTIWRIAESIDRIDRSRTRAPNVHTNGAGAPHRHRQAGHRLSLVGVPLHTGRRLRHRRSAIGRSHVPALKSTRLGGAG